jgi:oligoribonuclease NrnB/cAMP/cGMP phosphodiesterase (DHH superfamily)
MRCFFHSVDLDGQCSAAIVKFAHPECELIGINYGEQFPFDRITKEEIIWLVDFTLQPFENMFKLSSKLYPNNFIWIDHHKTAFEEAYKSKFVCEGDIQVGKGACELVWEYIFHSKCPEGIELLGIYDTWRFNEQNRDTVLQFQSGCRLENTDPNNQDFWIKVFTGNFSIFKDVICQNGKTILKYQEQQNERYVKNKSFGTKFEDLRAIVCNVGETNSSFFNSVYDESKYDIMITFSFLPSYIWTVSLYTTKEEIDVGMIAKKYGGGGHKSAAGFQCTKLPFLGI